MASMETRAPFSPSFSASFARSAGMAVSSLLLPSTASWPSTSRLAVAKAETRCSACLPCPRSWLRREVLPSMATKSGLFGQASRTHAMKAAENRDFPPRSACAKLTADSFPNQSAPQNHATRNPLIALNLSSEPCLADPGDRRVFSNGHRISSLDVRALEALAGACMLRATFDKGAWLEDHGVGEEWPTVGLPELIGVDNGSDFRSATFRRACENEGIRVEFRPPGRPYYGGHIERLMGTMMKDVHALPGTTFSSVAERGRQDPKQSAGLTLHELETYFAIEVVEGYHQRIHRGLQRAPIAVWREFIVESPLRMPRDRMAFWVSFLPEARRKLQPDGVHMFGSLKYWHGALATDLGRSGREVVVKYDPRDISRVFVGRPSGHFVEAHWSDLTWPAVSLHEWDNQQRERGRSARSERDTGAGRCHAASGLR